MKFKVFNVEFDGIDKCGKDSILKQIFSLAPNKYIINSRGIISQIAFSQMFNRGYEYDCSQGYLDNTLFINFTVDEADWNVRCDITNEHAKNAARCDVERAIKYQESIECFKYAVEKLKEMGVKEDHIMEFNTTKMTPYNIIVEIVKRLEELNK